MSKSKKYHNIIQIYSRFYKIKKTDEMSEKSYTDLRDTPDQTVCNYVYLNYIFVGKSI